MDDALGVGRLQPFQNAVGDDQKLAVLQAAFHHHVVQRRAFDIIHHKDHMAVGGAGAVGVAHDRIMDDGPHLLFPLHELDEALLPRELGRQRLDGHPPVGDLVRGKIDFAHAATAQNPFDFIRVVQHLAGFEDV